MRAQADGVATEIRAEMGRRFSEEIADITAEKNRIHAELQRLYIQMSELDRYAIDRRIRDDYSQKEKAELAPLSAALEEARAPIMPQVMQLVKERDAILEKHINNKRLYPGLIDGLDSQEAGMRMAEKDRAIKELFASVDRDLSQQISYKRNALIAEMYALIRDSQEKAEASRKELTLIIDDLRKRNQILADQLRAIDRTTEDAVDAAMPGKHAMFAGLREELFFGVVSGQIDPESFIAAVAA